MTEWIAGDYSEHSSLQAAMADEQLSTITLRGDERVLDAGCGDGKITVKIAERVPRGQVVGVDASRNMIEYANRHFATSTPNLQFSVAEVTQMPFDQQFDLVVSFNMLHWVANQRGALESIRRALVSGGTARLRFVPAMQRRSLEDVIEEIRCRPQWSRYFEGFKAPFFHFAPEVYRDLAEECGFRVLDVCVHARAWDFKSREAFFAFAHGTFVEWTRMLPEQQRDAFIVEVLDRYREVAATGTADANVFKFGQMDVILKRGD